MINHFHDHSVPHQPPYSMSLIALGMVIDHVHVASLESFKGEVLQKKVRNVAL